MIADKQVLNFRIHQQQLFQTSTSSLHTLGSRFGTNSYVEITNIIAAKNVTTRIKFGIQNIHMQSIRETF